MTEEIYDELIQLNPDSKDKIKLFGDLGSDRLSIRDPYFDPDDKGFVLCYQQCLQILKVFLERNM